MIFKGILLWFTAIFIIVFMSAIDCMTWRQIVVGLFLCVSLTFICTQLITERELDILSGNKLLKRIIEGKDKK